VIEQLDDALTAPRPPERMLVNQKTWDRLRTDLDAAWPQDVSSGVYKGIPIEVSSLVPDDAVYVMPGAEIDPFIRGEGTVTIDGEVIGTVNDRAQTHRAVLSDEAYWKAVEDHAVSIEQRLTVAEVELPAWVILRAGANAHEIGAELTLVHEIKPTTGGDRYHRVFLELATGRGLIQEQVDWPPAIKAPEPNAWHRALTDMGIIGG
jgi:hypothetical protein